LRLVSEVWLTSADPEPGEGAAVETEGRVQFDRGSDDLLPAAWTSEHGEPATWRKLAGNYGPVRLVREAE